MIKNNSGLAEMFCCCVSLQVSVITKTEEDDISIQYMLNFTGEIVSQKPSHLGQGKASDCKNQSQPSNIIAAMETVGAS